MNLLLAFWALALEDEWSLQQGPGRPDASAGAQTTAITLDALFPLSPQGPQPFYGLSVYWSFPTRWTDSVTCEFGTDILFSEQNVTVYFGPDRATGKIAGGLVTVFLNIAAFVETVKDQGFVLYAGPGVGIFLLGGWLTLDIGGAVQHSVLEADFALHAGARYRVAFLEAGVELSYFLGSTLAETAVMVTVGVRF